MPKKVLTTRLAAITTFWQLGTPDQETEEVQYNVNQVNYSYRQGMLVSILSYISSSNSVSIDLSVSTGGQGTPFIWRC